MIQVLRIILWLRLVLAAENIEIFPDVGIVLKKNSNLVLVNGIARGTISMRLNLPSVMITNEDECNAMKSDQAAFKKVLNTTITTFRTKISGELEEYMGKDFINALSSNQNEENVLSEVNRVNIGLDINQCDRVGVKCDFFPLVEDNVDDHRYHKLIPCYDASLGKMNGTCTVNNGIGVCCSRIPGLNKGKCPIDLGRAIVAIDIHLKNHPDVTFTMGHGEIPGNKIRNWCMALVKATANRKLIYTGPHSNGSQGRILPRGNKKKRATADEDSSSDVRVRRSNWEYLSHGWIFSSSYVDSKVSEVRDLEKSDISVIKEALGENSRTILKLEADKKEKLNLENKICSITGEITEQIVLNHLENTQNRLEGKAESLLRVCSRGSVPDEISTITLHKLCSSVTDSSVCSDQILVRSLFSCEIVPPKIDLEYVDVRFVLSFKIPVAEDYVAKDIISVGIPYRSSLIDSVTNVTEIDSMGEEKGKNKPDQKELKKALGELLGDVLSDRSKREIIKTYHFLGIRNLPEVMFNHNNDLILFKKEKCFKTNAKYGLICDYSEVDVRSSGCLKSIINKSTAHIKSMCAISLFSSNQNCIIKSVDNLGYIVSSHAKVEVITGENGGIFHDGKSDSDCHKICFIGVSNVKRSFKCGERDFLVNKVPDIEIQSKLIKLKKIDISDLTSRKHEISDLTGSGFKLIDNFIDKGSIVQAQTFSVVISILIALITGCVIMKCFFKRIMWIYNICKTAVCIPVKGSKLIFKKVRGQRRVGDYVIGDNYG